MPKESVLYFSPQGDFSLFLLFCSPIPSITPFLQMTANDNYLQSNLFFSFLHLLIDNASSYSSETRFFYFKMFFDLVSSNHSILLSKLPRQTNEKSNFSNEIQSLFLDLNTVNIHDRTIIIDSSSTQNRQDGERSNIYYQIFSDLSHVYDLVKASKPAFAPSSSSSPSLSQPSISPAEEIRKKLVALYQDCIDRMIALDTTRDFSYAVTDEIAPKYSSIITWPMDLKTMRNSCTQYTSIRGIYQDLNTIVTNAQTYNGKNSPLALRAQELLSKWREVLLKRQSKENELQLALQREKEKEVKSVTVDSSLAQKTLDAMLLLVTLAFETPAFRAQLLRAIVQRILYLLERRRPPMDGGKMEFVLFQYSQLLSLSNHFPEILRALEGSGSFSPADLLAKEPTASSSKLHQELFNFLFQELLVSGNGVDEDTIRVIRQDLLTHIAENEMRQLLYSSIFAQLPLLRGDDSRGFAIIDDLLQIIAKWDCHYLEEDWGWVQSVSLSLILHEVDVSEKSQL